MNSSAYLVGASCVLLAALLGCAHVPPDNATSSGATAQGGSQPPTASTASSASAAQAGAVERTGTTTTYLAPVEVLSPELVNEAEKLGFRPEKRNGTTVFCREQDADLGSRITGRKKQCIAQQDVATLVQREHEQQDLFQHKPAPISSH
jgi:hypothetical protein